MFRFARRAAHASTSACRRAAVALSFVGAAAAFALAAAPVAGAAPAPLQLTSTIAAPARTDEGKWYGSTKAMIGDFNGDGVGDLAIGGFQQAWIIYGSRSGPIDVDLTQNLGSRVTRFTTTAPDGFASVSRGGDFDHDGKTDLVLSTDTADYVVYGTSTIAGQSLALGASGPGVTIINTKAGGADGIGGIGDFDGDGYDDLGVSRGGQGAAIVGGGPRVASMESNTQSARVSLINSTQTCAFIFLQYHCGYNGVGFTRLGDFNGDGKVDVGISGGTKDPISVLYGRTGSFSVSVALPSGYGLKLPAQADGNLYGPTPLGDVNGDGLQDFLMSGKSIVFGRRGAPSALPANDPEVTVSPDETGTLADLQPVGDQNGDGKDDVVAYLYSDESAASGPLKMVTNVPAPPATLDLEAQPSVPLPSGRTYPSTAGGGDIDGDGVGDLLVGQGNRTDTYVLTHSALVTSGGGSGPQPGAATLDRQLTDIGPYGGRLLSQVQVPSSVLCPVNTDRSTAATARSSRSSHQGSSPATSARSYSTATCPR